MSISADAMTVARNQEFQDRVRYQLTKAAVQVMAEDPQTADHAARVAYAKKVIDGTADFTSAAAVFLTNPTLAAAVELGAPDFAVADGDLEFVASTVFGALAGIAL